jgi:hypothetical protein
MPNTTKHLIIGTELPSEPAEHWGNFAWLNPTTRDIRVYVNGEWVISTTLADTLVAEGYTGTIKHGKEDMVFENGLLIKYG